MKTLTVLLWLVSFSGVFAETSDFSFGGAIGAANRSVDLDLSREEQIEVTEFFRSIRGTPYVKTRTTLDVVKQRNKAIREGLPAITGNEKELDYAVVQFFFEALKPQIAFDWMGVDLTALQRQKLISIELTDELKLQLAKDRVSVVMHAMLPVIETRELRKLIGEFYQFRHSSLQDDFIGPDSSPDLTCVRVLSSPFIQKELRFTLDQVQAFNELKKQCRKDGILVDDPVFDDTPHTRTQREEIRITVIAACENLLGPKQVTRFRQILLRRYMSTANNPDNAILFLGLSMTESQLQTYEKNKWSLDSEIDAARRLRINRFVKAKVAEVMGDEVTNEIYGDRERFLRGLNNKKPELTSPVVKRLIGKTMRKNPRR